MENTARNDFMMQVMEDFTDSYEDDGNDCDIIEFRLGNRDSLSENFITEIDAWARQAMASNGFGDY